MAMAGDVSTIQMRFDADARSARRARRAVEECLNDESPAEVTQNAVLLTSELVTNAVTHALSAGELVAFYDRLSGWLRVEVRDNSPVLPQIQDGFTVGCVGGLGLCVVDTLATSWGATPTTTGKTVWFELKWGNPRHRALCHA
jgi:anti-sigma regulatory factor (Ser/Thr protein kinase)